MTEHRPLFVPLHRGVRPIPTHHLRVVEPPTPAPLDLYAGLAEAHQLDPDAATERAVYAEISDALVWLGLGAVSGALVTVLLAYGIAQVWL